MWGPPNYPGQITDPAHVGAIIRESRSKMSSFIGGCSLPTTSSASSSSSSSSSPMPSPTYYAPALSSSSSPAAFSMVGRAPSMDSQRTTRPIVVGASVLGIKYADGVMIASDATGFYGSLAMFPHFERIRALSETSLFAAGGDLSDFQEITRILGEKTLTDFCHDDGKKRSARELWSYLSQVMYNRRNKMDPLWNQVLVAGFEPDEEQPFLGYVDLHGTAYPEDIIATGYGRYIAIPLLRRGWRPDLSESEARTLLANSMRVLQYRECRTLNSVQFAKVTKQGPVISPPQPLELSWDISEGVSH